MNARTCTHTKIRVHVLTSIEAERGREREKERVKRRRKEEEKREEGRRMRAAQRHNLPWTRHGTIYSPEAATFFRISTTTSGTMIASPKHTYTHIHTHTYTHACETFFQGVVSLYRGTNEVPAPSAGRKKDNGRKEWGSISWFLQGVLNCRLPVLAAHHRGGVYAPRVPLTCVPGPQQAI